MYNKSYNSILLSTPQKNIKRKEIFSLLRLIFVPSSIRDTSDIWIKLMKPCQYYESRSTHLEGERNKTKREDQHPAKRTSLKSANTQNKGWNQPICSKLQQARVSAITQGKTMCTFSTGAHLQPLASFLFFWFNFCDVSKLVIHKNISQIWL